MSSSAREASRSEATRRQSVGAAAGGGLGIGTGVAAITFGLRSRGWRAVYARSGAIILPCLLNRSAFWQYSCHLTQGTRTMAKTLDRLDRKILEELQAD